MNIDKEVLKLKLTEENLPFIAGLMVKRGLTVQRRETVYNDENMRGLLWSFIDLDGVTYNQEADLGDVIVMLSGIQLTQEKFRVEIA